MSHRLLDSEFPGTLTVKFQLISGWSPVSNSRMQQLVKKIRSGPLLSYMSYDPYELSKIDNTLL